MVAARCGHVFEIASKPASQNMTAPPPPHHHDTTPHRTAHLMDKNDTASATAGPLTKELVVQNKMGIHARPAAMVVRITNKYKADVFVEKDGEQVNGKSIMGLMMLAAGKGSKVKFIASGADAQPMLAELEQLFARKFEEA
jgi:phosphocarrier protein